MWLDHLTSTDRLMILRPSRSHCTTAPPMKTLPSSANCLLRAEDLLRVVLDPAGLGEDLAELLLSRGARAPMLVEHDGARAGRALVEGEQVAHGKF